MQHESRATPILLASASPRRKALLAQLGIDCEVVPTGIDESRLEAESPADYVRRLALEKGRAALERTGDRVVTLIAADTAVAIDGDILGKPVDREDAERMLLRLSGAEHGVFTAVAVLCAGEERVALNRSLVRFRALSQDEIAGYWASGEPRGKAGAYAIQGIGAAFIEALDGSYSGVMGLPLFETARLLSAFGYDVLVTGR